MEQTGKIIHAKAGNPGQCLQTSRHRVIYLEELSDHKTGDQVIGSRGHDLDFLLDTSGLRPLLESDHELEEMFNQIAVWSVTLRYNPKMGDRRKAFRFLAGVHELRNWLESIC